MSASTQVSILHKAANILRKDCLRVKNVFTGSFSDKCDSKAESLPYTLSSFLHMLFDGLATLNDPCTKADLNTTKVITSIGQQIIFSIVERRSLKPLSVIGHIQDRETPASIYMAMKLFF